MVLSFLLVATFSGDLCQGFVFLRCLLPDSISSLFALLVSTSKALVSVKDL